MNNIKSVCIIYNSKKENASQAASECQLWLKAAGIQVDIHSDYQVVLTPESSKDSEPIDPDTDFCIVLGGDGTFLYAARKVAEFDIPLLCVNTGNLGFLSAVSLKNFYKGLKLVLENKYYIQKRLMLYSSVIDARDNNNPANFYTLNDVVISKGSLARLINLITYIDGNYVTTYNADGLIIATPTGSTAYALSSGGPILTPDVAGIVISPICPHTVSLRPLVVSDECNIKIELSLYPGTTAVMLTIDGQESFELNSHHEIMVKKSDHYANLIKFHHGEDFFDTLRTKLQWGVVNRF